MPTDKNINKTCLPGILPIRNVKSVFLGLYKFIVLFLTLEVSQTYQANKDELPAVIYKIYPAMGRGDKARRLGPVFTYRFLISGTSEIVRSVTKEHCWTERRQH